MADIINAKFARDGQTPDSAQEPYEHMAKLYGNNLKVAYVHGNYSHQDPYDFPKGAAIVFSGDTRLHPDPLNDRLCGRVMAVRIDDQANMDDEYFHQRMAQLQAAVKQRSTTGPTLRNRDPQTNRDQKEWEAQLGDHGHFVGAYKQEERRNIFGYWIVCNTDAGEASYELFKWLEAKEPGSIRARDFVQSPEYKYTRALARRNCARLIAQVATALDVKVATTGDVLAVDGNQTHIARPDMDAEYNVLEDVGSEIVYYNQCYNLDTIRGGILFLLNPCHGVLGYKSSNQSAIGMGWGNEAANSFPIGAGLASGENTGEVDEREMRFAREHLTWDEKTDQVMNPRVLNIYRDFTEQGRKSHVNLGVPAETMHTVQNFIPVAVKIPVDIPLF